LLRHWALSVQSQSVPSIQPQPGTVTIIATTTTTAAVPGMGAHRVGPSKAEFVSRIIMVRGTGMGTVTGTGTVKRSLEAASVGRPSLFGLS